MLTALAWSFDAGATWSDPVLATSTDQPGKFVGRNSQYSGGGFSDQFFEVVATSPADFDAWVAKAKQAPAKLDAATYKALDKQGVAYEKVDISVDSQARDYVMALGYLQAPVVVAGNDHWSGFRPDRIKESQENAKKAGVADKIEIKLAAQRRVDPA